MANELIILDGAIGTMLQRKGLLPGQRPELFGLEHPGLLRGIYREYINAGSRVISANTFGANRRKLSGSGVGAEEAVFRAVQAAKEAAAECGGGKVRAALDIGPIGELLEPVGTLSFDEAYGIYREMLVSGEKAGADAVILETFTDLNDMRAAVLAAKENTALPVWAMMSFDRDGRTFTGVSVSSMALTLEGLGVDAVGINCSLGPEEIFPMACELVKWTSLPVIIKPNAGLPDRNGDYSIGPEEFAAGMKKYASIGVSMIGGCCGTTPEYIKRVSGCMAGLVPADRPERESGVCSATKTVKFGGVRVIGERLNPTGKKRFQQALREHDMDYIMKTAIEQERAGADILDVNVGLPGVDEPSLMGDVVRAVQSVVSLPLQIDSSNSRAIEAGLRACCGRAIVNSVNGERDVLRRVLPIVKKYGAAVIGLAMDRDGIPETASGRFDVAERIVSAAAGMGIPSGNVIIDCLTLTVSAQQLQAAETLKAVCMVRSRLGTHCALGVSNISFGLPERQHVTESFLTQAMYCGVDLPIINPNQAGMMDAVYSYRVISGEDRDCAGYIERFSGFAGSTAAAAPSGRTVFESVAQGLPEETARLTAALLENMTELEVIDGYLIPALDAVGDRYEKQELFLPQLINAANAACAGFDLIKTRIAKRGGASISKGKVIVATVKGDIHDIGKNIVKVIMENYGYQVIDLGRDVPPETVADTAERENVRLVGLSALMTTTVPAMADTIKLLRSRCPGCLVWVGGAVLTQEYADEIGADFYAADARASVEIARKVFGE